MGLGMKMLRRDLNRGVAVIKDSIGVLRAHPKLALPVFLCWLVYAPIVLYLEFGYSCRNHDFQTNCLVFFSAILTLSFFFSFACLLLLEMLQQIESGKTTRFWAALGQVLARDLIKALPIMLTWAVIWFLLTLLEAIFSRRRDEEHESFSAESAAKTLAGYRSLSFSGACFAALRKGARMIVFLMLPAIAWEDEAPHIAMRKGLTVLRIHTRAFAAGWALSELAALVVFLPPALLIYTSVKWHLHLPDMVWYVTILYCSVAWTFTMFLEQMYAAQLYLWHLIWEKRCAAAQAAGQPRPAFDDVPRPSVRDGIPGLLDTVAGQPR